MGKSRDVKEAIKYRFIIWLIGPPKRVQSDRGTKF